MKKQQWMLAAILVLGAMFARAQTVEYIHTDALGSPVAITNASGVVIERTVYAPFGEVINRPATNGPGYTGHVMDAVTGLNYMQQRYYDPQLGRFLSNDPVTATTVGANFNRYWYANNNPYRFVDPDGRCPTTGTIINKSGEDCSSSNRIIIIGQPPNSNATRGSSASESASEVECAECNEVLETRRRILQDGQERLHEAGVVAAKEGATLAAGGLLGRIARFFRLGSKVDEINFRSDTSHIFRNARGHLAEDTPANRALLKDAVRPENFIRKMGPNGSISVYRKLLPDGRQVWVEVRNGTEITNGGVNLTPRG